MNVFIDIETIPDQSEGALDSHAEGLSVKCPFKTKAEIGKDLGLDADTIKFTGAEDLKARWVSEKGSEQAKAQAEEKWIKTALNGNFGQIVCLAYSFGGQLFTLEGDEELILKNLTQKIDHQGRGRPAYFIAHNAAFDLPFLFKRYVINRVKPPAGLNPYGRHEQHYFCTMQAWEGFKGMVSQDDLAKMLGVKGKVEGITGADVWPLYKEGQIKKIVEYCKGDVESLMQIYNRLTFSQTA